MGRCAGMVAKAARKRWAMLLLPAASAALACSPDRFPLVMPRAFLGAGAVFLLVLGAWFAWKRAAAPMASAVLAAVLALLPVVQWEGRPVAACGKAVLAVAQMNVHEANRRYADVVRAALACNADILSVQETDRRWWNALEPALAKAYPWRVHGPGEANYGISLFSRLPMEQMEVVDLEGLPAVHATLLSPDGPVAVWAVHLRSPESAADLAQRNRQWAALARVVNREIGPVCVVGDVNTVPWDGAFRAFVASSGMAPCGPQQPTWPAAGPAAWIPLDHVFVPQGACALGRSTFKVPGSDHRGVIARFRLPR